MLAPDLRHWNRFWTWFYYISKSKKKEGHRGWVHWQFKKSPTLKPCGFEYTQIWGSFKNIFRCCRVSKMKVNHMYAISGNEKLPPNMCTTDLEFGIETSDEILVWMSPAIVSIEIKGVNIGWSKRGRIAKFWAAFPLLSPVQGVHATRVAQFYGLPPNLNQSKRILPWSKPTKKEEKETKRDPEEE